MASRWMQPKLDKLKRYARIDGDRLRNHRTISQCRADAAKAKANMQRDVANMPQLHGVTITRYACEGIMPRGSYSVTGKNGARATKRTYGNGAHCYAKPLDIGIESEWRIVKR